MRKLSVSPPLTQMPEIRAHPFFQRRGFIPQGQDRAPPIVEPPRIEEIARPVKSEREIDPDILKSLCALWPGSPESEIVDALLSSEWVQLPIQQRKACSLRMRLTESDGRRHSTTC
jgi:hypothetical protein